MPDLLAQKVAQVIPGDACSPVLAAGEFFGSVELVVCGLGGRGSGEGQDKGDVTSEQPSEGKLKLGSFNLLGQLLVKGVSVQVTAQSNKK